MKFNKETTADLLRDIINEFYHFNKSFSNENATKLQNTIKGAIKSKYGNSNLKNDISQQAFLNFYQALDSQSGKDLWEKIKVKSEDSDNILISYYYKIIQTAYNSETKTELQKETLNLESAIRNILNRLVSEEYLCKNSRNEFCRNEGAESIHHIEIKGYFYSIQNKNGTINHSKLEKLIRSFFDNELENFAISLSDLVRIIAEISDVGNSCYVSIIKEKSGNEDTEEDYLEAKDLTQIPATMAETNSYVESWFSNVERTFKPEELKLYAKIFILKYYNELTYESISKRLNNLGKSSIELYYKAFIRAMKIDEEATINTVEFDHYIKAFAIYLIKKFDLTESEGENSDEYVS